MNRRDDPIQMNGGVRHIAQTVFTPEYGSLDGRARAGRCPGYWPPSTRTFCPTM